MGIEPEQLPIELARRHRDLAVGETVTVVAPELDVAHLRAIGTGAGFTVEAVDGGRVSLRRDHTLADTVGPGMRVLTCGLNPSIYSADAGVGYARPGNRFWPAAIAAGLVTRDRDPHHALAEHGVGMTDTVKRATRRAAELDDAEYRSGLTRLTHLVGWLRPRVICFVGLAGWRAAVDRTAVAGRQPAGLAGVPVYLMPSTSGLNAHSRLDDLAEHFLAAATLADDTTGDQEG